MRAQVQAIKKVGRPIITVLQNDLWRGQQIFLELWWFARSMVEILEIVAVHPQNIQTDFLNFATAKSLARDA